MSHRVNDGGACIELKPLDQYQNILITCLLVLGNRPQIDSNLRSSILKTLPPVILTSADPRYHVHCLPEADDSFCGNPRNDWKVHHTSRVSFLLINLEHLVKYQINSFFLEEEILKPKKIDYSIIYRTSTTHPKPGHLHKYHKISRRLNAVVFGPEFPGIHPGYLVGFAKDHTGLVPR